MSQTFDLVCQVIIAIFGLLAIILVARNNRWGFVVGILQQPFWFFTSAVNEQWGIFLLSIAYLFSWTYGVYRNFWKQKEKGMSKDKVLAVLNTYRRLFARMGVKKKDHFHGVALESAEAGLSHCHGMLDEMVEFVKQDRMGKVFRWLGFIQGFLWAQGVYTLDDLKNQNRP